MKSMSKDEFIAYAHEVTSPEALEPLYDAIAETANEVAMFGDAGPGATLRLLGACAEVRSIEATLARLEHREPRNFHFGVRLPR